VSDHIETHLMASSNLSKKDIIMGNFLGGLAWGLGSVIGATVVVAILIGVLRNFNWVPFIHDVTSSVEQKVTPRTDK
jgi:hypothetical protein